MNNKENAGGFLCNDEERLLISRAAEMSVRGEDSAVALSFLSPREQRLVFEAMQKEGKADRLFFWGGYPGAERRRVIFIPLWLESDQPCSFSLFSKEREEYFISLLLSYGMEQLLWEYTCAVKLTGSGYASLSHRDYLGALMGLGLKRSVIGDICIESNCAAVFCEYTAASFIIEEMKKAGRDRIKCERLCVDLSFSAVRRFEEICTTVASLRLDGAVRALCNISRDDALSLVKAGDVELNYFCEKEPDRAVASGDIISVRGHGKYIIDSGEDVTRRGRLRLLARKYV